MNTPHAVFFDLDETLITNTREADALFAEVFRQQFAALDATLFEPFMDVLRKHAAHVWDNMFDHPTSPSDQLRQAMASAIEAVGGGAGRGGAFFEAFTAAAAANCRLNPNAREVLETLRGNGLRLGIITNGFEALQIAKIRRHGLDEIMDAVIVSEQAGAHKPSPKVFEFALRKLGMTAACAWHVGDHVINDVAGAAGVGLGTVYYNPALAVDEAASAFPASGEFPTHVITDLAELSELLAVPGVGGRISRSTLC